MTDDVGIIVIEREFPEFKYTTQDMFDILGNKLSDKVKENIMQLGVDQEVFCQTYGALPSKF